MKIRVVAHIPELGGFMKDIFIEIPDGVANDLMGKKNRQQVRQRDDNYWMAVEHVKLSIALKAGIKLRKTSYKEQTLKGDSNAQIGILKISKYLENGERIDYTK